MEKPSTVAYLSDHCYENILNGVNKSNTHTSWVYIYDRTTHTSKRRKVYRGRSYYTCDCCGGWSSLEDFLWTRHNEENILLTRGGKCVVDCDCC